MEKNKTALICGVTGQDGSYLAQFLLKKGYEVWGTSRDVQGSNLFNLKTLGVYDKLKLVSLVPEDFRSVYVAIKQSNPDEVYYLAGQSSVGLSFELPVETIGSVVLGALNILEAIRLYDKRIRLYHAGSSESFGDTYGNPANEKTPFNPRSPYAVAKASAYWLVNNYREAYDLYACTGIFFNHESALRPERFVTKKIISVSKRIASGSNEKLTLGRLDISRDWGWAPEYVDAMWRMLQLEQAEDFVISTGVTVSLESFVEHAFNLLGLDWKDHVVQDHSYFRPTDILISRSDPSKARDKLGWVANIKGMKVVEEMLKDHV